MGIEAHDLIFVFDVDEDRAFAIDGRKLRLAGQRDGGNDFLRSGIDDGDIIAAAVEGPDGLRGGFKNDAIGIGADGDSGDGRQGLAIEDDDGIAAAIGDVAKVAGIVESDAVSAVQAGDGADGLAGLRVDDFHARPVSDVEPMRGGVGEQIIPSAFAAEFPVIQNVVGLLRRDGKRSVGQRGNNNDSRQRKENVMRKGSA